MANTTPDNPQNPDTPTVGGNFTADNSPPFGDPDQALYGGHGSLPATPKTSAGENAAARPGRHRAPE